MKFDELKSRSGTFEIDRVMIESNPHLVIKLMKNCLIYKAEIRDYFNSITYWAFSPNFELLSMGTEFKKYGILQHRKILKKNVGNFRKGDMITYKLSFDGYSSKNIVKIDE